MLLIIGFFVFMGAQQELVYARMREAARRYRVGEVMQTGIRHDPRHASTWRSLQRAAGQQPGRISAGE